MILSACCGAARGSSFSSSPAARIAAGTFLTAGASAWGFVASPFTFLGGDKMGQFVSRLEEERAKRRKRIRRWGMVLVTLVLLAISVHLVLTQIYPAILHCYRAAFPIKTAMPTPEWPTPFPSATPLPTLAPTLTAIVIQPPTSAPDCTWSAAYVADVTIPDGTILRLGEEFTKTWRIRNDGTCDWDDEVALVQMSGEEIVAPGSASISPTLADEMVDVTVIMAAPETFGDYVSAWSVCCDGRCFGFVTVVISVE